MSAAGRPRGSPSRPPIAKEAARAPESVLIKTNFDTRLGLALVLLLLAAAETLIIVYALIPQASGVPSSAAGGLVALVYVVAVAGPVTAGIVLLLRTVGSPRKIRLGDSSATFEFFRKRRSFSFDEVLAYDTGYGVLSGARFLAKTAGGNELRATDVPIKAIDKLVDRIEGANPRVQREDAWSSTARQGRPDLPDRRDLVDSKPEGSQTPMAWVTRTKAERAWWWAAILPSFSAAFFMFGFVGLVPTSSSMDLLGTGAAVAGVGWLALVALGAVKAHAISAGRAGSSSLSIDGRGPEAVARAVQAAAQSIGVPANAAATRRFLGVEVRRWRLGPSVRVSYFMPPSKAWSRITVRTNGVRMVDSHKRVKGAILQALEGERKAPLGDAG